MADLSQTAANVKVGASTTRITKVTYGETITQGMPVYLKAADGLYWKCDASTAAEAVCAGIALTPGVASDTGYMALPSTEGADQSLVNLGATLTVGTVYSVSATAGAICPVADISSTQYVTVIGVAKTAALLDFQIAYSSVAKA